MLRMPALLLVLTAATGAHAGAQERKGSAVLDEALACRSIADPAARLACFDQRMTVLAEAKQRKDIAIVDREGVRAAKRGLFGFSLPKIRLFGDGEDDAETDVKQLDSVVTTARAGVGGLATIVLKDGSIWQTTEARMGFNPRSGDEITITAGPLGSYFAKIKGGRSSKVKRLS